MRALIYDGQRPRVDANFAPPPLPDGEALIRPTRMGVCGTDIEICKGYMGYQGALGHEFVGIVEDVASKQDKGWVGRRVVGTINCVCTKCDMCKAGLGEHCRDRTVLGIQNRHGCFADRFALPVRNLLAVPESVDDDRAVFTEPLAACCQILRQITVEGRPYITVLGDGRLGMLCVQVLARENATVRLVGKHPDKMAICDKWNIPWRHVDEVGLRTDQDIVVDCTGSRSGLITAMGMVRPRGKLVLKSTIAPGGEPIDLSPIVINEIDVIGSRCGPFPEALRLLAEEQVDVLSLISRRLPLDQGADALKLAQQPNVVKVLLS